MTERRLSLLLAAAIFVLTVLMFWQTTGFDFVNYDDHRYVYENARVLAGLNANNVRWAFTTFEFSNWHPLTWLSLMFDATIFGDRSGGYHLTNLLLHAMNAGLLALLLARLTRSPWRSALVATVFAIHPLHVESVAWVSSRKDVLSMLFGILSMMAYCQFVDEAGRTRSSTALRERSETRLVKSVWYTVAIALFAMSLMSKPTLVTLPLVLILLDWWPMRRVNSRRDWLARLIEKIPMLMLSLASSVISLVAQSGGGAIRDTAQISLSDRVSNAVIAYATYVLQTIWPADLAVFYPYSASIHAGVVIISAGMLLIVTVGCVIAALRGSRPPMVGWMWFLIALVPMIGLVQVGAAAHADRYTYFPLIGLFILIAWLLPGGSPVQTKWSTTAAIATLVMLAAVCWFQIGYWRDSATLASRALSVTADNWLAHTLMGTALTEAGDLDEAIAHLQEAVRIEPTSPQAWHNLGFAYAQLAMNEQAMDAYRRAISLRPDFAENHYNLGLLLQAAGRFDEARIALQHARELADAAGDEAVAAAAIAQLEDLRTSE